MTPELLNKLKHLANIAAHLPHDVTIEDEDATMKALHGELAADTVLELIALAERTTAPVSLTDEKIIEAIDRPGFAWENLDAAEQRNLLGSIRALLAAAPAPIQQVPTAWCTDAHFEAWCDRHDMRKDRGDHREMFDDAASLYLTVPATPPALAGSQVQAAVDVLAERERQKQQEGWTPEHDDQYVNDELSCAAACYTLANERATKDCIPGLWMWPDEWWKPTTERRNLVKAGALILAEIERLDRAAMREKP